MPQPTASRALPRTLGTAAAIGLGMIPLHRLPWAVRAGYIVLPAAFVGGTVLFALRRVARDTAEEGGTPRSGLRAPSVRGAALALAVGGLTASASAASIRVDRSIEMLLRRRGLARPRVWMGVASGAFSLAMGVLEDRAPAGGQGAGLPRSGGALGARHPR